MNRTRSTVIFSVFSFVIFVLTHQQALAQNQTPPTAQEMADKEVAQMKKDLALTADQETNVKPIVLKYAQKRKEIMDASKGDHAAAKTKMQALDTQMDAELKDVLTADQLKKWQTIRSKRQGPPPGNRPAPSSGNGG